MKQICITIFFTGTLLKLVAQTDDGRTIKIPVIFHVLYADSSKDNGINDDTRINGNSSQYLPTAKILAELKDLHDDFLLLNKDTSEVSSEFKRIIGNPNVNFYLADTILEPNGEKGIIRIQTNQNKCNLYKTDQIINPQKYLNVYVGHIRTKCWPLGKFTNGFTPVPFDSLYHEDDAVYLNYEWVGLNYRLLTHEVGHWLGLWHVFEGECKNDGDRISDTPPQIDLTDVDCLKCPTPSSIDLSCDKSRPYNYNNYMDYSGCRKMFTVEQVDTIRQIVQTFRPEIWRSSK